MVGIPVSMVLGMIVALQVGTFSVVIGMSFKMQSFVERLAKMEEYLWPGR